MDTPVADRQSRRLQAPDTVRAITSCWISLAPSKIVLCSVRRFLGVTSCCAVGLTRCFANLDSASCCRFRRVLGTRLGIGRSRRRLGVFDEDRIVIG